MNDTGYNNYMEKDDITDKKIGLIAGNGELPILVAQSARQQGFKVISVCFDMKNFPIVSLNSDNAGYFGPGEVEKILRFLKDNCVDKVMFIGKVSKWLYFRNPKIDPRAVKALARQKRLNDDAIMLVAIEELEKENFEILDQTIFIKDFFVKKGLIAGITPNALEQEDIEYGFEIAKAIGKLDIGQTVVVKDKMILAVEAIEGTDQTIKRGCSLASGQAVVVKVSKPLQDQRFDVPVIGTKTVKTLKKYGGKILAIEADKTLVVNEEEVRNLAKKLKITVIAI